MNDNPTKEQEHPGEWVDVDLFDIKTWDTSQFSELSKSLGKAYGESVANTAILEDALK